MHQKKIKDLQADKLKLKALLRKAKEAIESVNNKHKTALEHVKLTEVRLEHAEMRVNEMQSKASVQKSQVSQILARIKVGETGYSLI